MSTSVLKALPGKLNIKRHSPSILYISASLAMSKSVLKALPGKLDIKRHSPSILYVSASFAMSASVLKALSGKLDVKRHSPSILYISASLAMSSSILKVLPGTCKLNIKGHSPSILYVCTSILLLRAIKFLIIQQLFYYGILLYKTLIRPQLEYGCTVWSPHTAADTFKIESVQRRAARWACRDYQQTSSVTRMLETLHWRPLDQRRIDSPLIMMYNDLVTILASKYM